MACAPKLIEATEHVVAVDVGHAQVVTASGDPDIESQIATDWNLIAGL